MPVSPTDPMRLLGFEPLEGVAPVTFLDAHREGQLLALQATVTKNVMSERAAVWEAMTGRLVWEPQDVCALCWMPSGTEILLVSETRGAASIDQKVQASPSYSLERLTWPEKQLQWKSELTFSEGWPKFIVASPIGAHLVAVWADQHSSGFEYFHLSSEGAVPMPGLGRRFNHHWIARPAFSPDGVLLFAAVTYAGWWKHTEPTDVNDDDLTFHCGEALSLSLATQQARPWFIPVTVSREWVAAQSEASDYEYGIGTPEFVNLRSVRLPLPVGAAVTFPIDFSWVKGNV